MSNIQWLKSAGRMIGIGSNPAIESETLSPSGKIDAPTYGEIEEIRQAYETHKWVNSPATRLMEIILWQHRKMEDMKIVFKKTAGDKL